MKNTVPVTLAYNNDLKIKVKFLNGSVSVKRMMKNTFQAKKETPSTKFKLWLNWIQRLIRCFPKNSCAISLLKAEVSFYCAGSKNLPSHQTACHPNWTAWKKTTSVFKSEMKLAEFIRELYLEAGNISLVGAFFLTTGDLGEEDLALTFVET